jgi:hypothetical protein
LFDTSGTSCTTETAIVEKSADEEDDHGLDFAPAT